MQRWSASYEAPDRALIGDSRDGCGAMGLRCWARMRCERRLMDGSRPSGATVLSRHRPGDPPVETIRVLATLRRSGPLLSLLITWLPPTGFGHHQPEQCRSKDSNGRKRQERRFVTHSHDDGVRDQAAHNAAYRVHRSDTSLSNVEVTAAPCQVGYDNWGSSLFQVGRRSSSLPAMR